MIVVVSEPADTHASAVMQRLEAAGRAARLLDLSRFPREIKLNVSYAPDGPPRYELEDPGTGALDFARVDAIWWRRPQPFVIDPAVGNPVSQSFAQAESYAAFSGLWLCAPARWMNHPTADDEAGRKVYQLKVAQEVGLEIPATLVTNDPAAAKDFANEVGVEATVYKAFSGTMQAWRETRVLAEHEVELLDAVAYAPVIFQRYVAATLDLRVTVVGERIFAVAIHSQETSYRVDYRMDMDSAPVEPYELPPAVEERLRAFMRRLGLVYGAIDMRVTPDGDVVFLEVNPSGQWLFVEQRSGLDITGAVTDALCALADARDEA